MVIKNVAGEGLYKAVALNLADTPQLLDALLLKVNAVTVPVVASTVHASLPSSVYSSAPPPLVGLVGTPLPHLHHISIYYALKEVAGSIGIGPASRLGGARHHAGGGINRTVGTGGGFDPALEGAMPGTPDISPVPTGIDTPVGSDSGGSYTAVKGAAPRIRHRGGGLGVSDHRDTGNGVPRGGMVVTIAGKASSPRLKD